MFTPPAGKIFTLVALGSLWLLMFSRVSRLAPAAPFHVAAYSRDRIKAKFYYRSIWAALAAALVSLLALETLSYVAFDSTMQREWILSVIRGLGLWGVMTIAMIWSQIGKRAAQIDLEGRTPTPLPVRERDRRI